MRPQELIPIEDAAAEFGVHRTTIFRHITEGRLMRHTRMGDRRTFVDRWEVQRLVEDPAVARCLQEVYDRFRTTGVWPLAREIQRELDRGPGPEFDFLAALESLPQELGWRMRDIEGRAQLTLRGMARCDNSSDDVSAFLGLMRTCYERYIGDEGLEVTSGQLAESFGFDALALERLFLMVQVEAGFWNSLGRNPAGWTLTIESERIRHFRDVRSVSDYLGAKQRAYQPRPGPAIVFTGVRAAGTPVRSKASLHAAVAAAVEGLEGTAAVVAAASALEQQMAERLGDGKGYGAGLVSRYFDAALRGSPPDARRVEALRSMALSAFGAYRNFAAHGRMEFTGAQASEIVGLFSLLNREIDATPMPRAETNDMKRAVPYAAATPKLQRAFAAVGHRQDPSAWPDISDIPDDWFCENQGTYISSDLVGVVQQGSGDSIPVCMNAGCTARGWEQVHPQMKVPEPRLKGLPPIGMPARKKPGS